jgi:hypothetical protein
LKCARDVTFTKEFLERVGVDEFSTLFLVSGISHKVNDFFGVGSKNKNGQRLGGQILKSCLEKIFSAKIFVLIVQLSNY